MNEPAKILVIDDELGICEGCKRALTPQGYVVDMAVNGEEGKGKIQANGYDLVLLDVMMPDISGLDLLSLIHQHDPEIVCIIITGYATVELAVRAIKQGAYDFLAKPFTSDELLLAVNQGLERRRLSLETKRLQAIETEARRLVEDKARLEEIDQAKKRFIRLITHELQAPMAAIQSYLGLMRDGYIPPEEQNECIEKCLKRAQEQFALLADLLELGQLQEVKTHEPMTWVQLDGVLREVIGSLGSQAEQKHLELAVGIADRLPVVRGAVNPFKSLWTNLIGNAIKYTPPGGRVEISLRESGGRLIGQVRDTGIGIPPEARGRLFDEFFRAENAKAFTRQGTGLGLAIVKQIVEDAGGQVSVESVPGKGSTFTFTLPAAEPQSQ